jgi:transcriptional regulator with XRE-family HTH domain
LNSGSSKRQVADRLGADPQSVNAWELTYHQPSLRLLPAITEFLGYDPNVVPDQVPLGRRIATRRRAMGLSQQTLAGLLGMDDGTLRRLEQGRLPSTRRIRDAIEKWLSE